MFTLQLQHSSKRGNTKFQVPEHRSKAGPIFTVPRAHHNPDTAHRPCFPTTTPHTTHRLTECLPAEVMAPSRVAMAHTALQPTCLATLSAARAALNAGPLIDLAVLSAEVHLLAPLPTTIQEEALAAHSVEARLLALVSMKAWERAFAVHLASPAPAPAPSSTIHSR